MKPTHISKTVAGVVSLFTAVTTAPAAVIFSVDMDPITPGIQSSISVFPGAAVPVDLWATVDALGLSSFSVSAMFDLLELAPMPPGGAASQPPLPGGLAPLAVPDETMEPAGLIKSFNGATFGPGPASVSFVFGSIAFVAPAPTTDALADVTLGYFVLTDGAFDSGGLAAPPTFVSGKVDLVPEPASVALLAVGGVGLLAGRRKRTR